MTKVVSKPLKEMSEYLFNINCRGNVGMLSQIGTCIDYATKMCFDNIVCHLNPTGR